MVEAIAAILAVWFLVSVALSLRMIYVMRVVQPQRITARLNFYMMIWKLSCLWPVGLWKMIKNFIFSRRK